MKTISYGDMLHVGFIICVYLYPSYTASSVFFMTAPGYVHWRPQLHFMVLTVQFALHFAVIPFVKVALRMFMDVKIVVIFSLARMISRYT